MSPRLSVALLVASGLLAVLLNAAAYTVNEREQVVILQFGAPKVSHTEAGIYFKIPFIQEVRRFPKTLQLWQSQTDITDLPTKDGKKIEVQAWAIWKITDPLQFVKVLRTVPQGDAAVKDRVRAAIRDEITSHDLTEVVRSSSRSLSYSFQFQLSGGSDETASETQAGQPESQVTILKGRQKITEEIQQNVADRLQSTQGTDPKQGGRGVELVEVGISNIGFVPAVQEAAFSRLTAFMESIASGYLNEGQQRKQEILNQTQAEVEKILGEGEEQSNIIRGTVDAEIIQDYAQAITETGEFYNFTKTLEVNKKALAGKSRLILTTRSDLFEMLKSVPMSPTQPAAAAQETTEANAQPLRAP
ncbi:MAG: protease modulator HflC [Planctomycetota bacterium]|nr:protease modulator HflC [Planctomycetota bacterium]